MINRCLGPKCVFRGMTLVNLLVNYCLHFVRKSVTPILSPESNDVYSAAEKNFVSIFSGWNSGALLSERASWRETLSRLWSIRGQPVIGRDDPRLPVGGKKNMPLYFASLVYSGQGASILVESVLTGEAQLKTRKYSWRQKKKERRKKNENKRVRNIFVKVHYVWRRRNIFIFYK